MGFLLLSQYQIEREMNKVELSEEKHATFLTTVAERCFVWYLQKDEGAAVCGSVDGERTVYLFWPTKAAAQTCAVDEWVGYEPVKVPLAEYLEVWLIPLYEQGHLIGTNWGSDLNGKEMNPLELSLELVNRIRIADKEERLNLLMFDDLFELEMVVKEALEAE